MLIDLVENEGQIADENKQMVDFNRISILNNPKQS